MAAAVIQGCFPHGVPRFGGSPVQAYANRHVVPLPAHLAHFPGRGGMAIEPAVRQRMETIFGAKFADVRVHVVRQASTIGARAFTQGASIYFAPGQYAPDTRQGQQLLAHELAHVVQQRRGLVRNPSAAGVAIVVDHALEAEADRMSQRALTQTPPISGWRAQRAAVQRKTAMPSNAIQRKPTSFSMGGNAVWYDDDDMGLGNFPSRVALMEALRLRPVPIYDIRG